MNGLSGSTREYTLYFMDTDGKLNEYKEVQWTDSTGDIIDDAYKLSPENIYEVRLKTGDSGAADCDSQTGIVKVTVILAVDN